MTLPPKLFEPCRIGGGVSDRMLNVPVSKIILNQARVCPLIREGEAAGMAKHVGMGGQGKPGHLAIFADRNPGRPAVQGGAALTHKESVGVGFHPGPIGKPSFDSPQLVGPQRMRGREALFQPGHVKDAAFCVHLGQNQAAGLGDAQAMPEHEKQKAPVAGFVSCALGGC